ncbi:hypothetical protein O181_014603 [Austropuccinia psidii MF-1]|uniref:Retroviral polymerase SH3-like domain-containing protein n=1 Tax=Austropuccinia psidii MF-1 TaxID=1389203 RepID=A0A9Q3C0V3_9BASI|nr:hypothetical protein [Austropuccinia psidii MF-1]
MAIPRHHCKWKLAPAREKGVLLGYENDNTPYRILRLNDMKVAITKHETFDKAPFPHVNQGLPLTNPITSTNWQQLIVETNSAATVDEPCEVDNQSLPLDMVDEFHAKDTSPAIISTEAPQNTHIKVICP